jgi:hypothetical protein
LFIVLGYLSSCRPNCCYGKEKDEKEGECGSEGKYDAEDAEEDRRSKGEDKRAGKSVGDPTSAGK